MALSTSAVSLSHLPKMRCLIFLLVLGLSILNYQAIRSDFMSFSHPSMASPKTSLKLLVDKKGQRVLFAEATEEFIDFLFHIFSLPLGTLIELLGSKQMVGCLGKLKDSIDSFNETFFQPGIKKDDIFNPKTPYKGNKFLLSYYTSVHHSAAPKAIYRCTSASNKCYNCDYTQCPIFEIMTTEKEEEVEVKVELEKKVSGSYVKEVVTYMVMDNLVVKPMSTISSINIINSFGVQDLSQLEEKMVSFGKDEALKLLKAALTTEKVLTTLFLHNNHVKPICFLD